MANIFRELGRLSAGGVPKGPLRKAFVGAIVLLALLVTPKDPVALGGGAALLLAGATVYSAVEIVNAYEKRALTVFGEYRELLEPGINVVPPFVSRTYAFDLRTQTLDVPRQEAITEDNSPVAADAVVYIRVVDAKRAFLEVDDYEIAVSNLAQTTLRAVLGDMELDDTLSRRDEINARIRRELDEPTDAWGIRVESVEVREVRPSPEVENAMEQQTSAERRRRAMILEAQGERRSAVEKAEGEKQSNVIRAQGEKQSQILEAQGDAISTVLRAKSAESMGERAIIEKGMETLQHIGEGESTTFVLPQELTSLVGRYGKQLSGSDVQEAEGLESQTFDAETREMLGLDAIEEIANATATEAEGIASGTSANRDGPDVERQREGTDAEWRHGSDGYRA
ncbi:SPFH domain-containing protein [Halegenticoccus tardaugens]|uniref:SPFH domain-containing protein n=1 Tax=Halegenticoccus tardaugens TaxID=2071624 RepID=UPI00100C21E5|nr:SPFH domain-containing protein [Halegenticoccus tardaugens]